MPHDVKKYLQDILGSIDGIKSHTNGIKKFVDFVSNRLVYRAVERELEIIAEAITRINKVDGSIEISQSKKIIGLRNRVIHAYDTISEDIVWGVVVNHIDNLKTEVEELIKKFE
ncbi:MAG: hypothetical protein JWP12_2284 [Bacteroidetes bacterium]|nr:hypothetical protein [Bacteroidota bacterium]